MTLISIAIFLLILISGSFFAYCFYDKKFEETLPISCYSIVVVTFIFGFINLLKYSIYVILLIAIFLYILSFIKISRDKKSIKCFFSLGFIVFLLLNIYFIFTLYGKYFNSWDEFAHWGDIVKVMCEFNDFGTNPITTSEFKSYPPAMALFQYFIEKINSLVNGNQFVEWLCNYGYSILITSSLLWLIGKFRSKTVLSSVVFLIVIIGIPFFFYEAMVYKELLIDPSLSFILAALMLDVMWSESDDLLSDLRIILGLFVLVLLKDVGIMLGFFIFISYAIKKIYTYKTSKNKKHIIFVLFALLMLIVPKILWNIDIRINNAMVKFSNSIDFQDLFLTLLGKRVSYRNEIINVYFDAFNSELFKFDNIGLTVNYIPVILVSYFSIIVISVIARKNNMVDEHNCKSVCLVLLCLSIVFILGMCVIYMYKFTKAEALVHASFNRYQRIVILALYLYIVYSLLIIIDSKFNKIYYIIFIVILLFITPIKTVFEFSLRASARTSISIRNTYQEIIDKTFDVSKDNSKIWFISQHDTGYDIRYYRVAVRPNIVLYNDYFILCADSDEYAAVKISADDWMNKLCLESYDYVVLFNIDEQFIKDYSTLFENKDDIYANCIYKVNKEEKKLSLCE